MVNTKDKIMNKLELAELFHQTYEGLAPSFGYKTKEETKEFDENSPNGKLMIATCKEILRKVKMEKIYSVSWEDLSPTENKKNEP